MVTRTSGASTLESPDDKGRQTRAGDWPQITAEALETNGQSYARAIEIALNEGRISEETAEDVRHEIG